MLTIFLVLGNLAQMCPRMPNLEQCAVFGLLIFKGGSKSLGNHITRGQNWPAQKAFGPLCIAIILPFMTHPFSDPMFWMASV